MKENTRLGKIYRALFKPNPFQRLTSNRRMLPEFLIIGAMKAGTTSLFHLLKQHPDIKAGVTKEVHFFDVRYQNGLRWYQSHFPIAPNSAPGSKSWATFESSPYYLFHPHAPRRVQETLPLAPLLVMLRDPVRRAYSHYWHSVRYGYEERSFEQAVENEDQILEQETAKIIRDPRYSSYAHPLKSYLNRGKYADQLENWFQYFPREQFLILEQKVFYADYAAQVGNVYKFLGVEFHQPAPRHENKASYPPMDPQTEAWLRDYFQSHNDRLEALLGEKFNW